MHKQFLKDIVYDPIYYMASPKLTEIMEKSIQISTNY